MFVHFLLSPWLAVPTRVHALPATGGQRSGTCNKWPIGTLNQGRVTRAVETGTKASIMTPNVSGKTFNQADIWSRPQTHIT